MLRLIKKSSFKQMTKTIKRNCPGKFYSWKTKLHLRKHFLDIKVRMAKQDMNLNIEPEKLSKEEKIKIAIRYRKFLNQTLKKKKIVNLNEPKIGLKQYRSKEKNLQKAEKIREDFKNLLKRENNGIFENLHSEDQVFSFFGNNEEIERTNYNQLNIIKKKLNRNLDMEFNDIQIIQKYGISVLNETELFNFCTNRYFYNNIDYLEKIVENAKITDQKFLNDFIWKIKKSNFQNVKLLKILNIFKIEKLNTKDITDIVKQLFLDKKINADKLSLFKFIIKNNKELVNTFLPLLSSILENFQIQFKEEVYYLNLSNFPFLEFIKKDNILCFFLVDSILAFENLRDSKINLVFSFLILNKIEKKECCLDLLFYYYKTFGQKTLKNNIISPLTKIYEFNELETNKLILQNSFEKLQTLDPNYVFKLLGNVIIYYNQEQIIVFQKENILQPKLNKNQKKYEDLINFVKEKEDHRTLREFDIYKNNGKEVTEVYLKNLNIDLESKKTILDYDDKYIKKEKRFTFENMRVNKNINRKEKMLKILSKNFSNQKNNDDDFDSNDFMKELDEIIQEVELNKLEKDSIDEVVDKEESENILKNIENFINNKEEEKINLYFDDLIKNVNKNYVDTFLVKFFKMKIQFDKDTNKIITNILFDNPIEHSDKLIIKYKTNFGNADQNYNKYNLNKKFPHNLESSNFFFILDYLKGNYNRICFKIAFTNYLRNNNQFEIDGIKKILDFLTTKKMTMTILDFYYFLLQNNYVNEEILILFMSSLERFEYFYDENINLYKSYYKNQKSCPPLNLIKDTLTTLVIKEKEKDFEKKVEDLRLYFEEFQHINDPNLSPKENSEKLSESIINIGILKNEYLIFLFEITINNSKNNYSKIIYTELLENKLFGIEHLLNIFKFLSKNFIELPIFLQYYTEVILIKEEEKKGEFRSYDDELKLKILEIIEKNITNIQPYIRPLFMEFFIQQKSINSETISKKFFAIIYKLRSQKQKEFFLLQIYKRKKKFSLNEICKTITLDIIKETRDEDTKNEILEKMQSYFGEYKVQMGKTQITYQKTFTNPLNDFPAYLQSLNTLIFHSRFQTREKHLIFPKIRKEHPTKRPVKEKRAFLEQLLNDDKEIPYPTTTLNEVKEDLDERDFEYLKKLRKKSGIVVHDMYLKKDEEDYRDVNLFRIGLADLEGIDFEKGKEGYEESFGRIGALEKEMEEFREREVEKEKKSQMRLKRN